MDKSNITPLNLSQINEKTDQSIKIENIADLQQLSDEYTERTIQNKIYTQSQDESSSILLNLSAVEPLQNGIKEKHTSTTCHLI
jgi:hypothetical protein